MGRAPATWRARQTVLSSMPVSFQACPSPARSAGAHPAQVPPHEAPSLPLHSPIKVTTPDSALKSRDIAVPTNVCLVRAMVFPVVMYRCESWTIKKAECQNAFELWCWRRLLRVPQRARRSNQSIQNEINPEYSLEGLKLKLKLQYLGSPDAKN